MVTSIVLEWYNWSEHSADDLSQSRLTIYRNSRRIIYEEFDGRKSILLKQEGRFLKNSGERLFTVIEDSNKDMTKRINYTVDVCDGSCWNLKIRHSGNIMQKLHGTIEYPPHGERVEREILRLCEETGIFEPRLFGCYGDFKQI